jgi:small redox-active disulfide protein 2
MKQIKVYGPGCKRCIATAQMIESAADRLGVAVTVEKVTDMKSMAMAGIMSTPGVAIDGKVVHAGGLPDPAKVEAWLAV